MKKDKEPTIRLEHDLFDTKPRKSGINSKKKGNQNELQCAKFLKEWTGLEFNRVPQSGGLRWKNSEGVTGDLVCEDRSFPFSVETKHYKSITFTPKLRENSFIYTVWKQALQDAERANKLPIAFLRENGMKKGEYMVYFGDYIVPMFKHLLQVEANKVINGAVVDCEFIPDSKGENPVLYGFHSSRVLKLFPYELFVSIVKP